MLAHSTPVHGRVSVNSSRDRSDDPESRARHRALSGCTRSEPSLRGPQSLSKINADRRSPISRIKTRRNKYLWTKNYSAITENHKFHSLLQYIKAERTNSVISCRFGLFAGLLGKYCWSSRLKLYIVGTRLQDCGPVRNYYSAIHSLSKDINSGTSGNMNVLQCEPRFSNSAGSGRRVTDSRYLPL